MMLNYVSRNYVSRNYVSRITRMGDRHRRAGRSPAPLSSAIFRANRGAVSVGRSCTDRDAPDSLSRCTGFASGRIHGSVKPAWRCELDPNTYWKYDRSSMGSITSSWGLERYFDRDCLMSECLMSECTSALQMRASSRGRAQGPFGSEAVTASFHWPVRLREVCNAQAGWQQPLLTARATRATDLIDRTREPCGSAKVSKMDCTGALVCLPSIASEQGAKREYQ